ncbi:MAG: transporter substrate-binding domain-containing protein [Endozoicomonas sp.]
MMKRNWQLYTLALMLFWSVTAFSAQGNKAGQSVIDSAVQRGTLRVGVSAFVPWVMKGRNGELVGYEIDVARRLGKDLGVAVEFVSTPWDKMIPSLLANRFDVVISGMTLNTTRNLKVNFSIPYSHSGVRIVANRKLAKGFEGIEWFNREAVTLAMIRGSSVIALAEKLLPRSRVAVFDDESRALQEVIQGRAHAMLASTPFPEHSAARYPDDLFVPVERRLHRTSEAFAVRKGDVDTLNVLNNWILQRLEDGWLQDRHDYWFTTLEWKKQVSH